MAIVSGALHRTTFLLTKAAPWRLYRRRILFALSCRWDHVRPRFLGTIVMASGMGVGIAQPVRIVPVPGMTVGVMVMASHTVLALDGNTGRVGLRVEPHMLFILLGDRDQSLVAIDLGIGVCFDLSHDVLEMQPAPGKLRRLVRGLGRIAGVERER